MSEPRFDHQRTDVSARVPVWTALGMLATIAVSIALVLFLMHTFWAPERPAADVFGPGQRPTPAAPALQENPQADLDALERHWQAQLHGFGWVDKQAGIVRIPIDVAMQRLAKQGLPQRDRPAGPVRSDAGAGK